MKNFSPFCLQTVWPSPPQTLKETPTFPNTWRMPPESTTDFEKKIFARTSQLWMIHSGMLYFAKQIECDFSAEWNKDSTNYSADFCTFSCNSLDDCLVLESDPPRDGSICVQGNTTLNVSGFSREKFGCIKIWKWTCRVKFIFNQATNLKIWGSSGNQANHCLPLESHPILLLPDLKGKCDVNAFTKLWWETRQWWT